jgi:hypothetical protein
MSYYLVARQCYLSTDEPGGDVRLALACSPLIKEHNPVFRGVEVDSVGGRDASAWTAMPTL